MVDKTICYRILGLLQSRKEASQVKVHTTALYWVIGLITLTIPGIGSAATAPAGSCDGFINGFLREQRLGDLSAPGADVVYHGDKRDKRGGLSEFAVVSRQGLMIEGEFSDSRGHILISDYQGSKLREFHLEVDRGQPHRCELKSIRELDPQAQEKKPTSR